MWLTLALSIFQAAAQEAAVKGERTEYSLSGANSSEGQHSLIRLEYRTFETLDRDTKLQTEFTERGTFLQNQSFGQGDSRLDRLEVGFLNREWSRGEPTDSFKTYFEGRMSFVHLGGEVPESYTRSGGLFAFRDGVRWDATPCLSVEGAAGVTLDSLGLDRGFVDAMVEVTLHTEESSLIARRRPVACLLAGIRDSEFFDGQSQRSFYCGTRLNLGSCTLEATAQYRESVNDDLFKGLDSDEGSWFYSLTIGSAF